MVTKASEWQGRKQLSGQDLLLPSGNTALVRQMSPTAFLDAGFMPDPLSNIVRTAINTKQGLPPKVVNDLANDPKKLGAAMLTFDRVLTFVVMEPTILMPPTCDVVIDEESGKVCGTYINDKVHQWGEDPNNFHTYHEGPRDPETLYADEVDLQDKIFVFQWALGGTHDLEKFREQQRISMESLQDGQGVRSPAKRAAKRK